MRRWAFAVAALLALAALLAWVAWNFARTLAVALLAIACFATVE